MAGNWKDNAGFGGATQLAPRSHAPAHLPFVARYPGTCFVCENNIALGEIIKRAGKRYAHKMCLSTERLDKPIAKPEERDLPTPHAREPRLVTWTDLMGRVHTEMVN